MSSPLPTPLDQELPAEMSSNSDAPSQPLYYRAETGTFYPLTGIRPINPSYIPLASQEPVRLEKPQKLLVILDLNGTLFHRSEDRKRTLLPRPHLNIFLKFLFENCRVMVWSSARAVSVNGMIKAGFGPRGGQLDRVWNREHFRLHSTDYHRKVLTLKDLEFVWEEIEVERQSATAEELMEGNKYGMHYDQTNTVLIDDSIHKSQLQPYNRIVLTDYDLQRYKSGTDIELLKVRYYLEQLTMQQNVSAYIKRHPFDPTDNRFESIEFIRIVNIALGWETLHEQKRARKKAKKLAIMNGDKGPTNFSLATSKDTKDMENTKGAMDTEQDMANPLQLAADSVKSALGLLNPKVEAKRRKNKEKAKARRVRRAAQRAAISVA
ncbi:hypothetical protein BGX26_001216 [Mortierella sp. AD094]|nr:hypothetical protein BGX26_001216 [Mortierella sp. AD094]